MPPAPVPADDDARVDTLHGYGVLDADPDDDLDAIVDLAREVTGSPTAMINLIDRARQWQAAAVGIELCEIARDESLCAHVVESGDLVHVEDARTDPRFTDNPFVTGDRGEIRMYAGAPLVAPDGSVLGSLCVVDPAVRTLDDAQLASLARLAELTMSIFEQRRRSAELRAAYEQLRHRSRHDHLTGLVNRAELEQALAELLRLGRDPALLFIDLDGFKQINDEHGHLVGDEVLVAVGARLLNAVRSGDTVGRLGGDEFVVLTRGINRNSVDALRGRIHDVVTEPILTSTTTVTVGVSIGVAFVEPGDTAERLLARADAAMYAQKRGQPGERS